MPVGRTGKDSSPPISNVLKHIAGYENCVGFRSVEIDLALKGSHSRDIFGDRLTVPNKRRAGVYEVLSAIPDLIGFQAGEDRGVVLETICCPRADWNPTRHAVGGTRMSEREVELECVEQKIIFFICGYKAPKGVAERVVQPVAHRHMTVRATKETY